MRNLLNFIMQYSSWLVFAIYVLLSCIMIFRNNPYQQHIYLSSAGAVASTVYDISDNVTSYFHLRGINEDLQHRNAALESEAIALRKEVQALKELQYADTMTVVEPLQPYRFILAHVINNSIYRPYNYITIERGSADGIKPEMGVVDHSGVVGIVNVVSEHYARVISLLNPNFRLSWNLKGSDVFGSLVWDGRSPGEALLEELPKHTVYHKGDTIITSGYSAVFPEGIPVGTVQEAYKGGDDNFFTLRIRLLTDFSQLSTVRVIANDMTDELMFVENSDPETKTNF